MHSLLLLAADQAPNPIVPKTNELVWGALAFLVLLAVLLKFVFPAAGAALEQRTARIQGDLDHAERERREADELLAQYRRRLDEASDEARRVIDEARESAERIRADLLGRAQQDAERAIERAQQEIRAERDRAVGQLRREVATLAVDLATRVVGDSLDRAHQLQLVDSYIDELNRSEGEPSGAR